MGRVRDAGNKSYGAVRIGSHGDLADEETITIGDPDNGGKVFEWDDDAALSDPDHILVDIGANAAEAIDNLKAAINAQLGSLVVAYDDPVETETLRLEGASEGALGNLAFETDMAHASNIIAAVDDALAGGSNDENRSRASGVYVVTALDLAAEVLTIPTPFTAPILGALRVVSSTDVPKYITDKPTISSTRIVITKNGATNLTTGDKVYWEVWSGN